MNDPDDVAPTWQYGEGEPLPGGPLAVDRLGVGARCETWLAWSTRPWCPVVVKLARPHLTRNPRAARALRRESSALACGDHPTMPRLLADHTEHEVPHLVMEYIDGPDLAEELDRAGPIAPADAALLCVQIFAVLLDLHHRGLAHLDMKPENVILRDGRPVLIDFGSTRPIGTTQPPGQPIGTAGYAAPEQEACHPVSATMDCYGVGSILYETLTCSGAGPASNFDELPLRSVVTGLLEPDPQRRMTATQAMVHLAATLPTSRRPWPRWADRQLHTTTPPGRAKPG
jgi:eukaryotic-like serine/threonine-protein kinase